jgi:hypothetical protein
MSTPTQTRSPTPAVAHVPPQRLRAHPDNVRCERGDLRELVNSIRLQGVLQPLRVEHRPSSEFLRIRAGHRRAAAAELAGLPKVPCVIGAESEADEAVAEMFTENLHRAGLSVGEKRDNAHRLMAEYTVDGVTTAVGVHPSAVYGWLREDPPPLQARPDGRTHRPAANQAYTPRVRLADMHALLTHWRPVAGTDGLCPEQARALLGEIEALLGGWRPPASTSSSVNAPVLAPVTELDVEHRRPVRELADRIGCHPKSVQRARAALRTAS